MAWLPMSGRLGPGRLISQQFLHDFRAAEILREGVDLDGALAPRLLALPLRVLLGGDHALVARELRRVGARARLERAALHRLAELLLDRLAGHRGEERGLQHAGGVGLALRQVDARGQAVARRARLERDGSALAGARGDAR